MTIHIISPSSEWVSEWVMCCCLTSSEQLFSYFILHFDNMMLPFALYRPTCSIFILLYYCNNNPRVDMSLHIILISNQPVASLAPYLCVLRESVYVNTVVSTHDLPHPLQAWWLVNHQRGFRFAIYNTLVSYLFLKGKEFN